MQVYSYNLTHKSYFNDFINIENERQVTNGSLVIFIPKLSMNWHRQFKTIIGVSY